MSIALARVEFVILILSFLPSFAVDSDKCSQLLVRSHHSDPTQECGKEKSIGQLGCHIFGSR